MKDIPKNKYLKDSMKFKTSELDLIDFFSKWLPEEIIDCHIHCNQSDFIKPMSEKTYQHMISTFPSFTLEESETVNSLFYMNKKVSSLRFPHVFRDLDQKKANKYLLENSRSSDRIAIFGLPEDIPYTIKLLSHPRTSALKMYYSYTEPNAKYIYECFPREILDEAERLGIPVIMHLPRVITKSKDDLLQTIKDYPKLKVVVPHLGSTKFVISDLENTYNELATKTNIFLDTSLNPSYEVVKLALKTFGVDRVMFGSDAPLNLIRSIPYIHPQKGQRIITEYKYHWLDEKEYGEYKNMAKDLVHVHWNCLLAIKRAVEDYPQNQHELIKQKIFYKNAKTFFKF